MGLFDVLKRKRGDPDRDASGRAACDTPHAADVTPDAAPDADRAAAEDVIEQACAAAPEKDPVALALRLLELPPVKRHGEQHPLLVAAVLVATWSNAAGEGARRAERVAEARRRSAASGASGGKRAPPATVGAAVFAALVAEASAAHGEARGVADRMAARAIALAGEKAAARCNKRDSLLSILAAVRFARDHLALELPARGVGCESSGRSDACLGAGCPFNR